MATNNSLNTGKPIEVPNGGTTLSAVPAYQVVCGGLTSTGALQTVGSLGSSGQVLTSTGAASLPVFGSNGSGELILIQTIAASGGSVAFTSGITNTYNNYLLVISNVDPSTTTTNVTLVITLSINGGSSYIGSGYVSGSTYAAVSTLAFVNANSTSGLVAMSDVIGTAGSTSSTTLLSNLTNGSMPSMVSTTQQASTKPQFSCGYYSSNIVVNAIQISIVHAGGGLTMTGNFSLYGILE